MLNDELLDATMNYNEHCNCIMMMYDELYIMIMMNNIMNFNMVLKLCLLCLLPNVYMGYH